MPEKVLEVIRKRILKKEEMLKKAKEEGDKSVIKLYQTKLALLRAEERYLQSGGRSLSVPDNLRDIELILEEKKELLKELKNNLVHLPQRDIDSRKFRDVGRILGAQIEYLLAKHSVILENRSFKELSSYIQLASEDGVEILCSPLEHEAEAEIFRPAKKVKKKRELTLDFRRLSLILVVLLVVMATYFGTVWRRTPYDRDIIRSYSVGRNHYLKANDYYVQGTFKNSIHEYQVAAAFFKKASQQAGKAAGTKTGKMNEYFAAKKNFFETWEDISLVMTKSGREFMKGDPSVGSAYAMDAVKMAQTASEYNKAAEDAWSLI